MSRKENDNIYVLFVRHVFSQLVSFATTDTLSSYLNSLIANIYTSPHRITRNNSRDVLLMLTEHRRVAYVSTYIVYTTNSADVCTHDII